MPEGSYTASLFGQGIDKIAKKVGEDSAEVIIEQISLYCQSFSDIKFIYISIN